MREHDPFGWKFQMAILVWLGLVALGAVLVLQVFTPSNVTTQARLVPSVTAKARIQDVMVATPQPTSVPDVPIFIDATPASVEKVKKGRYDYLTDDSFVATELRPILGGQLRFWSEEQLTTTEVLEYESVVSETWAMILEKYAQDGITSTLTTSPFQGLQVNVIIVKSPNRCLDEDRYVVTSLRWDWKICTTFANEHNVSGGITIQMTVNRPSDPETNCKVGTAKRFPTDDNDTPCYPRGLLFESILAHEMAHAMFVITGHPEFGEHEVQTWIEWPYRAKRGYTK
jgi:hypothetical protein